MHRNAYTRCVRLSRAGPGSCLERTGSAAGGFCRRFVGGSRVVSSATTARVQLHPDRFRPACRPRRRGDSTAHLDAMTVYGGVQRGCVTLVCSRWTPFTDPLSFTGYPSDKVVDQRIDQRKGGATYVRASDIHKPPIFTSVRYSRAPVYICQIVVAR